MRQILFFSLFLFLSLSRLHAQQFEEHFTDSTLRIDYTFSGDAQNQQLYVDELSRSPHWYGRRTRMKELPLRGNGEITVKDCETHDTLYRQSFSTLFQEWLATDEAKHTRKSFENVFLVPMPRHKVDITVELRDYHDQVNASITHTVDPSDILIRHTGERQVMPFVTLQQAADANRCIHVAYVAEGYRQEEMDIFLEDCRTAMQALFEHKPFSDMKERFNMVAVLSPSEESGISECIAVVDTPATVSGTVAKHDDVLVGDSR